MMVNNGDSTISSGKGRVLASASRCFRSTLDSGECGQESFQLKIQFIPKVLCPLDCTVELMKLAFGSALLMSEVKATIGSPNWSKSGEVAGCVTIPTPIVNGYLASCNTNQSVPSPELVNWHLFSKTSAG